MARNKYNPCAVELIATRPDLTNEELAQIITEKWQPMNWDQVKRWRGQHGLAGKYKHKEKQKNKKYPEDFKIFVEREGKGLKAKDLACMVTNFYGIEVTEKQMQAYRKNHSIKSGVDAKFKKGNIPWIKGRKMGRTWKTSSQFKPGREAQNKAPIGAERPNDGYIKVKIGQPDIWVMKHRLVWEAANGPIPEGHIIIHLDGNGMNNDISNLGIIDKKTQMELNRNRRASKNAEITKAGITLAKISIKARELKKGGNK